MKTTTGALTVGASSSTFTNGATFSAAINVNSSTANTITNTSIGTAQTTTLFLNNNTPATVGAQQYSPGLRLDGYGWKTTSTAGTQPVSVMLQTRPVQSTTNPLPELVVWSNANAGTYTEKMKIGTDATYAGAGSAAMYLLGKTTGISVDTSGNLYLVSSGANGPAALEWDGLQFWSATENPTLGRLGGFANFAGVYANANYGVQQLIANSATHTVDPSLGESIQISLGATATTGITITNSVESLAEDIVITILQDATGGRTLTQANFTNLIFPGGSYTVSSGANKRDIISAEYNVSAAKWYCTGLSQNM
jgi:hypothetical protein